VEDEADTAYKGCKPKRCRWQALVPLPLLASFFIAGVLEIAVPLLLGLTLHRRLGGGWRTYAIGCVMFALSLVRIPLNNAVSQTLMRMCSGALLGYLPLAFPSLTAGLFEESARFVAFRLLIKERSWEEGVMYGAGHGGFESMLLVGVTVLSTAVIITFFPSMMPPEQLQAISVLPAYMPLVGLYERLMAITIQIGLSVLVLQCFIHMRLIYFGLAIALHFVIDFVALATAPFGILWSELAVTAFAAALYLYVRRTGPSLKL